MRANTALRFLDLSCNELGPHGAASLGEALQGNTVLTTLRLASNGLGREGGIALAEGLRSNHALATLDLSANHLLEVAALAAVLPTTRIVELNLMQNRIGDRGCAALCAVLYHTRELYAYPYSYPYPYPYPCPCPYPSQGAARDAHRAA